MDLLKELPMIVDQREERIKTRIRKKGVKVCGKWAKKRPTRDVALQRADGVAPNVI